MDYIPSAREAELFAVMDAAYTKFKAADSYFQAARGQYADSEMAHSLAYAQIEQERTSTWKAYCKAFTEWDSEHERRVAQ